MDDRLYLFGIRHHGPGSAVLLLRALDLIDPQCVLIEGPPEADPLIQHVSSSSMKPPVAILLHVIGDPNRSVFMPFAEFSPEWQAIRWAVERHRTVRFIDWPAAVSLADQNEGEEARGQIDLRPDPLDQLAEAAGYEDGESFWNALVEQAGGMGDQALATFAAIESAMTQIRHSEIGAPQTESHVREARREAFMRTNIREALKSCSGPIAVVCGAWHVSALRAPGKAADDKALIKNLQRVKVETTWVPWTDSRLSVRSGYGAGVISPGWYRHLWSLYAQNERPPIEEFAASWQAKSASKLREEGYAAPTATAIEAARLSLSLSAMRGLSIPGLQEMSDASLATLCHGDSVPLMLLHEKVYIGERVGEISGEVPQMPLARDLAVWQRKTRLKPEDTDTELKVDLRSEAGLLRSTLLHRLNLIRVPWGKLLAADAGRGTFREVWNLRWEPELSVALADALIHGITIEQAASNATITRGKSSRSIADLTELIRGALVANLETAATECIDLLQAAAIHSSDITDLVEAAVPLVQVLRYGSARKLPESALRSLIHSLSVEINSGVRIGAHALDEDAASKRLKAMIGYDQALILFADDTLSGGWRIELAKIVEDVQAAPAIAGISLRLLHDKQAWEISKVAAAFSMHMTQNEPKYAGAFLEGFLSGGSEVILQDRALLQLIDGWICGLTEHDFVDSLPILRRSFSGFDSVSRRRLIEKLKQAEREVVSAAAPEDYDKLAFDVALPLLYKILGIVE